MITILGILVLICMILFVTFWILEANDGWCGDYEAGMGIPGIIGGASLIFFLVGSCVHEQGVRYVKIEDTQNLVITGDGFLYHDSKFIANVPKDLKNCTFYLEQTYNWWGVTTDEKLSISTKDFSSVKDAVQNELKSNQNIKK